MMSWTRKRSVLYVFPLCWPLSVQIPFSLSLSFSLFSFSVACWEVVGKSDVWDVRGMYLVRA